MNIESFLLQSVPRFPNNPKLPLLVYRHAVPVNANDPAGTIEQLFTRNGWGGTWRNGIYSFHHFHPDAHEVLGIATGSAKVQFGGPEGLIVEIHAGDVVVLPAGTAHKQVEASTDLLVVGAYPSGQEQFDTLRGDDGDGDGDDDAVRLQIAGVKLLVTDPVCGANQIKRWMQLRSDADRGPALNHE